MITFIMYFYLIQCGYSGTPAFSQMYLTLYNSLFGVALIIYFSLYEQDLNDDLDPHIWNILPKMYADCK
jgi:hypothetical protein